MRARKPVGLVSVGAHNNTFERQKFSQLVMMKKKKPSRYSLLIHSALLISVIQLVPIKQDYSRIQSKLFVDCQILSKPPNLNKNFNHNIISNAYTQQSPTISLSLALKSNSVNGPVKITLAKPQRVNHRIGFKDSNLMTRKSNKIVAMGTKQMNSISEMMPRSIMQTSMRPSIRRGRQLNSTRFRVTDTPTTQMIGRPLSPPYEASVLKPVSYDHQASETQADEIRILDDGLQLDNDTSRELQFVASDPDPTELNLVEQYGQRKPNVSEESGNLVSVSEIQANDNDDSSTDEPVLVEEEIEQNEQNSDDNEILDRDPVFRGRNESDITINQNDLNTANADESAFLAAQLPSQYDNSIRLPPDGYYDDYYKPGQVGLNQHVSTRSSHDANDRSIISSKNIGNLNTYKMNENDRSRLTLGQTGIGQNLPIDELTINDFDSDNGKRMRDPIENDNLKIIAADTRNSNQDPNNPNNEKLINYTSETEAGNVTNINSSNRSSPRLTFVHKDMNESHEPKSNMESESLKVEPSSQLADKTDEQTGAGLRRSISHYDNLSDNSQPQLVEFGRGLSVVKSTGSDNNIRRKNQNHGSNHKNHLNPVTEVHIDPKKLIMNPPIKSESGLLENLSKLPSKMKKMHQDQPDKNELMNELLTALDRVKVAIYKLQPLTAKMNAMYRKSVTSNTRDMIMDNHKGTYAKRYPPGDYDDSYDRINVRDIFKKRNDNETSKMEPQKLERRSGQVQFDDDIMETSASDMRPVLEFVLPNISKNMNQTNQTTMSNNESLNSDESQIVATGFGHRLNDGQFEGNFELTETSVDTFEDDDERAKQGLESMILSRVGRDTSDNDELPLFGYRVTIFQTPESEYEDRTSKRDEVEDVDDKNEDEMMATSESSLVEVRSSPNNPIHVVNGTSGELVDPHVSLEDLENEDSDELEAHASEKKKMSKKKKKHKEKEKKEKKHNEEEEKKNEKKKKLHEHKKMMEEESKRKKEYKKIKHNKGVVSKEKKIMKRDKQVKAHDRGAAKEKALKERTQIEFFEREQIVDDEFEKGKKSTVKAGWQTGHDSKKSSKKDHHGEGDTMSMGGSYYVKHADVAGNHHSEKGIAKSEENTSAKKTNKLEKKEMEAKGKKFKGWREKGYKIITETEFIDRGSLHDSAYKKRDKGASQHQKYKKHEASSEGHQGSLHEHMKHSKKKEEKKSKMHEKKEKQSKKEGEEKKVKKKVEKKKEADRRKDDQDTRASDIGSMTVKIMPDGRPITPEYEISKSKNHPRKQAIPGKAIEFKPGSVKPEPSSSGHHSATLARLLTASHDESFFDMNQSQSENQSKPWQKFNSEPVNLTQTHDKLSNNGSRLDKSLIESDRPINGSSTTTSGTTSTNKGSNSSNATVLDIIDNTTGKEVNKAKIGIYDLTPDQALSSSMRSDSSNRIRNLREESNHRQQLIARNVQSGSKKEHEQHRDRIQSTESPKLSMIPNNEQEAIHSSLSEIMKLQGHQAIDQLPPNSRETIVSGKHQTNFEHPQVLNTNQFHQNQAGQKAIFQREFSDLMTQNRQDYMIPRDLGPEKYDPRWLAHQLAMQHKTPFNSFVGDQINLRSSEPQIQLENREIDYDNISSRRRQDFGQLDYIRSVLEQLRGGFFI